MLLNPMLLAYARRLLARSAGTKSVESLLRLLLGNEPTLVAMLRRGLLQAYLNEARATASPLASMLTRDNRLPPLPPLVGLGDGAPLRWPAVEAAADWLNSRRLLSPDEFRALDEAAQRTAFTVARTANIDAVRSVQGAVADSIRTGAGLESFAAATHEALKDSALGEHGIETLYRTHVGQAQAAGQRAIIEHPLVADEFPYLLFTATHDSRTRPDHLQMEKHGQNGTAVYRRDDPIWQALWPPMGWNCRCSVVPLSIGDAARHGSREAMTWLTTGNPPTEPKWAASPYPVVTPPGWPDHRGIVAVV